MRAAEPLRELATHADNRRRRGRYSALGTSRHPIERGFDMGNTTWDWFNWDWFNWDW
ncbi:hypothetical protein GCM10009687_58100 [Asanoa iriomotensis]|uniref:Uncharacterized protein n=1 Tax=Asanoa iriomotensis TaxID=234613 RepID=A0ABQ4BU02_9ACTN|nr:hypothetical protein Air01nite_01000 [Asanoa iriomotensis]